MNWLSQIDPIYLFVAGCVVAAWVFVRHRRQQSRRRDVEHVERLHRPTGPWDGAQQDTAASAERQQVELYDLAREVTGRIDSKMMLLQQLIAQSQQQIDRLETLLAEVNERELETAEA